ncbi:MAG: FadR/GntR family transcriptional regulator [Christensenellales bacterium]|jgi:GntR family transcriptional repressor for pyruvate dehydrogenase complex
MQVKEKLYEQAFRGVRTYILQNDLKPGDLLPTEQTLCDMLGVSRNVLREAIKAMELMGMVSAQAGRGTVLLSFNLDFVFQNVIFADAQENENVISNMLDIRKKLELGYMYEAFRTLQEEDIIKLRQIMTAIEQKYETEGFFHQEDRDFHMLLFSRIENTALLSLLSAIWSVDENFRVEEKHQHIASTIPKHENIVRALEAGNEEAFVAAMLLHFSTGKYAPGMTFEDEL